MEYNWLSFKLEDECVDSKIGVGNFSLSKASKLFQQHTFKKSLEAYQDCVDFAKKTREEQSVIHNILSTQATLEYILGDFDKSLATLSSILSKDPGHFLSLLRRSQVYKKVVNFTFRKVN